MTGAVAAWVLGLPLLEGILLGAIVAAAYDASGPPRSP